MPNEPNKNLTVEIEPQNRSLEIDIQSGETGINLEVESLPVRVTRHAETAERLANPRRIAVSGDVVGDTMFDGGEDVVIGTAVEVMTTLEIDALIESAMAIGG